MHPQRERFSERQAHEALAESRLPSMRPKLVVRSPQPNGGGGLSLPLVVVVLLLGSTSFLFIVASTMARHWCAA
jgi:hypothetical protein